MLQVGYSIGSKQRLNMSMTIKCGGMIGLFLQKKAFIIRIVIVKIDQYYIQD